MLFIIFSISFCLQKTTDVPASRNSYTALHFCANLQSVEIKISDLVVYIACDTSCVPEIDFCSLFSELKPRFLPIFTLLHKPIFQAFSVPFFYTNLYFSLYQHKIWCQIGVNPFPHCFH